MLELDADDVETAPFDAALEPDCPDTRRLMVVQGQTSTSS